MATRTKEGSGHGKDKSSASHSTSQNPESSNAKRTHKPSASASPGKDSSVLSEKSVPNYLRPTISSTHETHRYLRKQNSEGSGTRRLTTRKSLEKHAHPSSSLAQKAPLTTAASKEGTLRTSSSLHAPRATSSTTRTIPSKTVKTVGIGRGRNVKKEAGGVKKKEIKQNLATSVTEGEEKEVAPDVTPEEHKYEDVEEHDQIDVVLPVEEQEHADSRAEEPNVNLSASNSPTPLEKREVGHATAEAEDRKNENCEDAAEHKETETEPVHVGEPQQKSEGSPIVKEQEVSGEMGDGEQAEEVLDKKPVMETETEVVVVTESDKGGEEIHSAAVHERSDVKGAEKDDHASRSPEAEELQQPKVESPVTKPSSNDRDVRGKKEAPAAYNDVIEETATKLAAEQRKNKVKALAGAFETVISLQNPDG